MKGQNIKNYYQKELNLMCETDKNTRNSILSLPRGKMSHRCCEKLTLRKWVNCWLLRTKTKPNTTEFHSCKKNGWHLIKQRKIKANNWCKNQSENKKSSNFFDAQRSITALRKKDESRKSCKSKRRQKEANRPLALRGHVTNASLKQWVVLLLMPKIDRAHKSYLTSEIWEKTHLREIFYSTLIFQQSSMICMGRHVGGHALALQHGGQNYSLIISC